MTDLIREEHAWFDSTLRAMLTNSLVPVPYERGGELAGVATVVGFCVSLIGT
jgi:hypothetical protein